MKKTIIILLLSFIGYEVSAQTSYNLNYDLLRYGKLAGSSAHSFFGNVYLNNSVVIGSDTASLSRSLVKTYKLWNLGGSNSSHYGFNTAATFYKTSAPFTGYGIGNVSHTALGASNTQNWTGDGVHLPLVGMWAQLDGEAGAIGRVSQATAFNGVIDVGGGDFTLLSAYNANRFNKTGGTIDTLVGYYADKVTKGTVNYDFWGRSALSRFDKGIQIDGSLSRIKSGYALRWNNAANDASFGIFNSGVSGANEAKIDANFVPDVSLTRTLGSSARMWKRLYIDTVSANVIIGNGSGLTGVVSSVSGTSNQITASTVSGAVTLSLPSVVGIDGTSGQLSLNSSNAGKSYFTLKSGGTAYGYFAQEGALLGTSSTTPVLYSAEAFKFYSNGAMAGQFNAGGKFVLTNTPTTSAGSYKTLTRNTSTGEVEQVSTSLTYRGTIAYSGVSQTTITVSFGQTLPSTSYSVALSPTTSTSATQDYYITNKTTTQFDVVFTTSVTAADFDFIVAH